MGLPLRVVSLNDGPTVKKNDGWNKFTRNVLAFGDLIREKTIDDHEEIFWFLTVVQNAIILWNSLSLERILPDFSQLSAEDAKRILPTMTEHVNAV